jgi:hypothetical protein
MCNDQGKNYNIIKEEVSITSPNKCTIIIKSHIIRVSRSRPSHHHDPTLIIKGATTSI